MVAPGKGSSSWPRIARSGGFCVCILAEDQEPLARAFAAPGGDKFTGVPWHPGGNGAPVLDGVLGWVECRVADVHDAGDHHVIYGAVEAVGTGEGRPLVFYRGTYGGIRP